MRVPDGPGEAPAGPPGGRKIVCFHWFYKVFVFSMHRVFWLILLALGGVHVASEIEIVCFSLVLKVF